MKIAFIVWKFPSLSETFILNQIEGLLERGHEVDIFSERTSDETKFHPIVEKHDLLKRTYTFHPIPEDLRLRLLRGTNLLRTNIVQDMGITLRSLNSVKYGKQALSLWMFFTILPGFRKTYDIIHCQFGTQTYRGRAFQALYSPSAKLITTFRGHDISSFLNCKGRHVYDDLFRSGDFFLTNCDFFRSRLLDLGCPADRAEVLRSGLHCDRFPFSVPRRPPSQPIRIVTVGRLVEKKGIEYAIQAVAQLAEVDLVYEIIGDGPLRESLENLVKRLNIQDRVCFLGWRTEQEIIETLSRSHLFLAPSITAKDGNQDAPINVLKEAMAIGRPVISTYHGGIPELVEDNLSGLLVPERDVESLVVALRKLIAHPETWPQFALAGRSKVEKEYDQDLLNEHLEQIYRYALTQSITDSSTSSFACNEVKQ